MRPLLMGALAGILITGLASAQTKPAAKPQTPAEKKMAAPMPGDVKAGEAKAPEGEVRLGTVRLTKRVMANGKPLDAGTYQVRVTAETAKPDVVGITEQLERWVEFLQGTQVKGREVVSIVPADEIRQVADDSPPRPGAHKVQMLKGNDYLRVWINRGGTHYLIHMPPA